MLADPLTIVYTVAPIYVPIGGFVGNIQYRNKLQTVGTKAIQIFAIPIEYREFSGRTQAHVRRYRSTGFDLLMLQPRRMMANDGLPRLITAQVYGQRRRSSNEAVDLGGKKSRHLGFM
jgi:hypothetical protein